MTVPVYIAECAPVHMRGRLVTLNNLFITGGQCVASVVDGAFSYDKQHGWRYLGLIFNCKSLNNCLKPRLK
jgi:SP family myo-inositol transporter-like MFS transporter 13